MIKVGTSLFLSSANLYFHTHDNCLTQRAGVQTIMKTSGCVHACVCAWACSSSGWHFKWTKKALPPWTLFSITTETSVAVQESMFWILCLCVCEFENAKNVQVWQTSACNCGPIVTTAFDKRGFSSKWCWKWYTRLFGTPYHCFFSPLWVETRGKQYLSQLFYCMCAPAIRLHTTESDLRL